MPSFKDIMGPPPPEFPKETISGAFACGECTEVCTEAIHDKEDKKLIWTCKNGHVGEAFFNV